MSVAKGVPKYEGRVNVLDTMMSLRRDKVCRELYRNESSESIGRMD